MTFFGSQSVFSGKMAQAVTLLRNSRTKSSGCAKCILERRVDPLHLNALWEGLKSTIPLPPMWYYME